MERTLLHLKVTAFDKYIEFRVTDSSIYYLLDKNEREFEQINLQDIVGMKYAIEQRIWKRSRHFFYCLYPALSIYDFHLFLKLRDCRYIKIDLVSREAFDKIINCLIIVLQKKIVSDICCCFLSDSQLTLAGDVLHGFCDTGLFAFSDWKNDCISSKFYLWSDVIIRGDKEELVFYSLTEKRKIYSLVIFEMYNLIFLANVIKAVHDLGLVKISDLLKRRDCEF